MIRQLAAKMWNQRYAPPAQEVGYIICYRSLLFSITLGKVQEFGTEVELETISK